MSTTIPRNATRKIAAIKERVTTCEVHSLRNDFAGVACDQKFAWDDLGRYHQARLTDDGDGRWTIHIHGNLWYRLHATTGGQ